MRALRAHGVWFGAGMRFFHDLRRMKVNLDFHSNFHSIFFTVIGLSLYFVPLAFLVRGLRFPISSRVPAESAKHRRSSRQSPLGRRVVHPEASEVRKQEKRIRPFRHPARTAAIPLGVGQSPPP